MDKIITSALGKINWRDVLHGAYLAVLAAVVTPLTQWMTELQSGNFTVPNFKVIGIAALSAFVGYLIKQLLTSAQIITPAPQTSR